MEQANEETMRDVAVGQTGREDSASEVVDVGRSGVAPTFDSFPERAIRVKSKWFEVLEIGYWVPVWVTRETLLECGAFVDAPRLGEEKHRIPHPIKREWALEFVWNLARY